MASATLGGSQVKSSYKANLHRDFNLLTLLSCDVAPLGRTDITLRFAGLQQMHGLVAILTKTGP